MATPSRPTPGIGLGMSQQMRMQQVLAPQMQQSLQLLQVPTLELRQLVHQEMQTNPLLEEITTDVVPLEAESGRSETREKKEKDELDFKEEYEVLAKLDEEWREYFSSQSVHRRRTEEEEEQRQFMLDSIVQPESLQEHLLNQLRISGVAESEMRPAELIIGSIDDNGYLTRNCSACGGTGRKDPCPRCTGSGYKPCPHCKGTGLEPKTLPQTEGETPAPKPCVRCQGDKRELCTRCEGTGREPKKPCLRCRGSGREPASLEELSQTSGVPVEKLDEALKLVQTFSPIGVGARDIRESLLIQLERLGKSDSLEARIVANHLEDLGHERYAEIARALKVDITEVQQAAKFISTLEPCPGRAFSRDTNLYIVPDVVVRKIGDEFIVLMNDEHVPHLRISSTYRQLMERESNTDELKEYLKSRLRAAKFIIKSIHQRQQTIYNIAVEIVKRQRDFFEQGVGALKPLTMNEVAQVVGVHETTVSRAVSNKYIQTPHGVFEMKYFFTTGYQTADGQQISNTSVKDAVAKLIAEENPAEPISDQEIVRILGERGIKIARRTVAKYRAELKILPSHLRKKT